MRPEPGDAVGPGPLAVALAGLVALAVAMGIGRFAFTPLMPMMLAERLVDLPGAGALASANYLGYLAGALGCMLQPWAARRLGRGGEVDAPRMVRAGLLATGALTLVMALPWPALWPLWRFAAGVASAVVLVYTSGWCLATLSRQGAGMRGGVIYAGPGAGIVVSGLAAGAMLAAHWSAAVGWLVFGTLAFVLTALVWPVFREPVPGDTGAAATTSGAQGPVATDAPGAEFPLLAAVYGLAGFGYIITATFLPVIAREALPGSAWIDLFWPLFGAAVVTGALLASRLSPHGDRRLRLAVAYAMQAAGIGVSLVWPTLAGFIAGSLLLGLPFTAITFFTMQEVRRLRPQAVASAMGLATVLYGIGQIVGPLLVSALVRRAPSAHDGFGWALATAAAALLAGMVVLLGLWRRHAGPAGGTTARTTSSS